VAHGLRGTLAQGHAGRETQCQSDTLAEGHTDIRVEGAPKLEVHTSSGVMRHAGSWADGHKGRGAH
jgi:hypothetical protein